MNKRFALPWLAICLFWNSIALGQVAPVASAGFDDWIKSNQNSFLETYLHLHRNPELSFQEKETALFVAGKLREIGLEVTENIGGHGLAALLKNGDGPMVMVRTDLDGLPITEQTGLPYASRKTMIEQDGSTVGTMHACGHDVHMTCLLGVAKYLKEHSQAWRGSV